MDIFFFFFFYPRSTYLSMLFQFQNNLKIWRENETGDKIIGWCNEVTTFSQRDQTYLMETYLYTRKFFFNTG